MITVEKLIQILWKPFIVDVENGLPVFFTFNRSFISDLLNDEGISCKDPVELINEFANKYIIVKNNRASLMPNALDSVVNGFSPAIIIVCQQILAVEEMVNDEDGIISAESYFPRLRKMISIDLDGSSLNPFKFEQFKSLWKCLACEVSTINGCNEDTITFKFDEFKGKYKASIFPFSQALFTRQDLFLICAIIGEDIRNSSRQIIWQKLMDIRQRLPRRASQRLLHIQKEKILDQIENFLQLYNYDFPTLDILKNEPEYTTELTVYKAPATDWLGNDEYRMLLNNITEKHKSYDEQEIHTLLTKHLKHMGGFIILPLTIYDTWIQSRSEIEIIPGDSFLIIMNEDGLNNGSRTLSSRINVDINKLERHDFELLDDIFYIMEVLNEPSLNKTLFVKNGAFLDKSAVSVKEKYTWIGGCCIENRTNLYFVDFLPERVRFFNRQFEIHEVVTIDSHYVSLDFFKNDIKKLCEEATHIFEFPGNNKANIRIVATKQIKSFYLGFAMKESSYLEPVSSVIEGQLQLLSGYCFVNVNNNQIPVYLLAELVKSIVSNKSGERINKELYLKIKNIAINSSPTEELRSMLDKIFNENVRLPLKLIQSIQIYL